MESVLPFYQYVGSREETPWEACLSSVIDLMPILIALTEMGRSTLNVVSTFCQERAKRKDFASWLLPILPH